MTALDLDDQNTVGAHVDSMLAAIAEQRRALESNLALAAKTLYPELWREISWLRSRNRTLEAEVEQLRAQRRDETPTVTLPAVNEQPTSPAARRRGLKRGRRP